MVEVFLAILIVFGAMLVRGFTGFGGALLTVPLLSLLWDVQLAVVVVAVMQVTTGGILTIMSRDSVARGTLFRVVAWSLIGLAAGVFLLSSLPTGWITRSLGVFSLGVGLHMLLQRRGPSEAASENRLLTSGAGVAGGVLQGMVGTGGPVIVPYLQRLLPGAAPLRSTLLAYFLSLDLIRLIGYIPLGVADTNAIVPSLYLMPVAIAGSLLGGRMHLQVSPQVFRLVVAGLLILSGLVLLW